MVHINGDLISRSDIQMHWSLCIQKIVLGSGPYGTPGCLRKPLPIECVQEEMSCRSIERRGFEPGRARDGVASIFGNMENCHGNIDWTDST